MTHPTDPAERSRLLLDMLETHQDRPCLQLMNGFALTCDAASVTLPRTAQRVVAYLGLRGRTQRDALAGKLWAESPERSARAGLRNALWKLTRLAPRLLAVHPHRFLALNPEVCVDVDLIKKSAWSVIDSAQVPTFGRPTPGVVAVLSEGDLLPGWYDEWLDDAREEMRQVRMHALESFSQTLLTQGRYALALRCALEASHMEPLRETAAAAVIKVHLEERNVVEAVRYFDEFARRLADELGVRPSVELCNLLPVGTGVRIEVS